MLHLQDNHHANYKDTSNNFNKAILSNPSSSNPSRINIWVCPFIRDDQDTSLRAYCFTCLKRNLYTSDLMIFFWLSSCFFSFWTFCVLLLQHNDLEWFNQQIKSNSIFHFLSHLLLSSKLQEVHQTNSY